MPRYEYVISEYDADRPWIITRSWTQTGDFADEGELWAYALPRWPEPRYGVSRWQIRKLAE